MDTRSLAAGIIAAAFALWTMLWVAVGAVTADAQTFWPFGMWLSPLLGAALWYLLKE